MRYGSQAPSQTESDFLYPLSNGHGVNGSTGFFPDTSIDELDNIRLREITGKAVSGTLLLMLKWFKRSRKFLSHVYSIITAAMLTYYRYFEIRIYDPAPTRLELPASDS